MRRKHQKITHIQYGVQINLFFLINCIYTLLEYKGNVWLFNQNITQHWCGHNHEGVEVNKAIITRIKKEKTTSVCNVWGCVLSGKKEVGYVRQAVSSLSAAMLTTHSPLRLSTQTARWQKKNHFYWKILPLHYNIWVTIKVYIVISYCMF